MKRARRVVDFFIWRKGFHDWWHPMDDQIKKDIQTALAVEIEMEVGE